MPVLRDDPRFPRSGWTWRSVSDAGAASETCDYCGQTQIRYVHQMTHPTAGEIRVGCDCADELTQHPGHAEAEEKPLRARAKRENSWLTHPDWQETAEAGLVRRIGGRECVTFVHIEQAGLWWAWRIERHFVQPPVQTLRCESTFPDRESARRDVYLRHFSA